MTRSLTRRAGQSSIDDLTINFDDLPDETAWRYLEAQGILPLFAGGKASPGVGGAACDRACPLLPRDTDLELT